MARFNKLDIPHQWKDEFTKYPHGYSIFESISKWVKLVNTLITNINQWNEYLAGFTSTFGEVPQQMVELRQEMSELINSVNSELTTITDEVTGLGNTLLSHLANYASYLASELGEEHIIRTLPNGVKDEIRASEGKLIKRTKKIVLQASDIKCVNPYNEQGIVVVNTVALTNYIGGKTGITGNYILDNYPEQSSEIPLNMNTSYIGYSYNHSFYNITEIRAIMPLGTTLEQARIQLAGLELTYQLAEPEIIDLPEQMTPNTREIVRLSEQVDKLINML